MQFVAEHRIENGLQIVTLKILNLSNRLYIKKSCKFLQSYEKTSDKSNLFELIARCPLAYRSKGTCLSLTNRLLIAH